MKKYRLVHAFVHAGIAALLYAFLTYSERLNAFAYADYIRAAALLVLPFLFVESNRIADILVERVPGLSFAIRKALTGSDFVEGDWPLVVMQADGRTPKYFGSADRAPACYGPPPGWRMGRMWTMCWRKPRPLAST